MFVSLLPRGKYETASAGRHPLLIIYFAAVIIGFGGAALFAWAF